MNIKNSIFSFLKKYGVHILIEVFIIVVGVLIALQVNNWNESRNQNKQLKGILKKIIDDWEADTTLANQTIKFYEPFIDGYNIVLNEEVTDEYLDTCKVCRGLITAYLPFSSETSGLELLKNYVNSTNTRIQSDTTIIGIIHGQTQNIEILHQMNERLKNNIDFNVDALTSQDWFADLYTQGKSLKQFKEYYKSKEFRNNTARHKIMVENNLVNFLRIYKSKLAEELPELQKKYESM